MPEVGRFASPDTIVPDPTDPQSFNRYSYTNNNPINFIDPSGHAICVPGGMNCRNPIDFEPFGFDTGSSIGNTAVSLVVNLGCGVTGGWCKAENNTIAPTSDSEWIANQDLTALVNPMTAVTGRHLAQFVHRYGHESLGGIREIVKPEFIGKYLAFTQANFRENLARATGFRPTRAYDAHHVLPQAFKSRFERIGIDIHNPEYGSWVNTFDHSAWSHAYQQRWEAFFETFDQAGNSPSLQQILNYARNLAEEFGFDVNFRLQ